MKPGIYPDNDERDSHADRPEPDFQHVDIEVGIYGTDDRRENERKQQVATHPVVPPQSLCIVDTAKHAGHAPHQEAKDVLRQQHEAGGDAQVAVGGVEVAGGALPDLVGLDDEHAGGEEEEGQQVEGGVGAGAGGLVGRARGRLEDQDGLGQDEDAGRLEERVRAEERDQRPRVLEGGGPYQGDEQDRAGLGETACPWVVGVRVSGSVSAMRT